MPFAGVGATGPYGINDAADEVGNLELLPILQAREDFKGIPSSELFEVVRHGTVCL